MILLDKAEANATQKVWLDYTLRDKRSLEARESNTGWYMEHAYTDKVKALLDEHIDPSDRVLDIGCGVGKWMAYLVQKGTDCIGIDYSEAAVEKAHQVLRGITDRLVILRGDATHLPFDRKSFDAILAFGLLEHFPNHEEVLQHWVEFLRDQGKAILSVPNALRWDWMYLDLLFRLYKRRTWIRMRRTKRGFVSTSYGYEERWTPEYLRTLCRGAGFQRVTIKTFFTLSPLLFYIFGNRIPFGLFKGLSSTEASDRWGLYLFAIAER